MPNAADQTNNCAEPTHREDFTSTAFLVEQDFRRLVETLRWMVRTAEQSDEELMERLVCAKKVTERGLRLSKLLTNVTRKPRD